MEAIRSLLKEKRADHEKLVRKHEEEARSLAERCRIDALQLVTEQKLERKTQQLHLPSSHQSDGFEYLENDHKLSEKHKEECRMLAERSRQDVLGLLRHQQDDMRYRQVLNLLEIENIAERVLSEPESHDKEALVMQTGNANDIGSDSLSSDGDKDLTINTLQKKFAYANEEVWNAREVAQEVISGLNEGLKGEAKRLIDAAVEDRNLPPLGVKLMGSIDPKPWLKLYKKNYNSEDNWETKAGEAISKWEALFKDADFHPFKIVPTGRDAWKQEIDHSNEQLISLKEDFGDAVYQSVTLALTEMEEWNASGRYPVPHVWNLEESRMASLKEVITYLGAALEGLVAREPRPKKPRTSRKGQ